MKFNAPVPPSISNKIIRHQIAIATGWTYDYIDGLSYAEIHDFIRLADATAKARKP